MEAALRRRDSRCQGRRRGGRVDDLFPMRPRDSTVTRCARAARSSSACGRLGLPCRGGSAAPCCTTSLEGMQKSLLPFWKLWVPVLALVAAVGRDDAPRSAGRCARLPRRRPAPLRRRRADGSTRRAVLRAGGAAVAASVGGAAAAVGRNAGWMPVGRDIFDAEVESTAPTAARRSGRTRASRAIAGSGAPTRWCPTSRSAPGASATSAVPAARARARRHLLRHRARLLRRRLRDAPRRGDEGPARQDVPRHQVLPSPTATCRTTRRCRRSSRRSRRACSACRPTTST